MEIEEEEKGVLVPQWKNPYSTICGVGMKSYVPDRTGRQYVPFAITKSNQVCWDY